MRQQPGRARRRVGIVRDLDTGSGPLMKARAFDPCTYGVEALNWMRWTGTGRSLSMLMPSAVRACGPIHVAAVHSAPGSNPYSEVPMR